MKGRMVLSGVVVVGLMALITGQVVSQEGKPKGQAPGPGDAMMEAAMKFAEPGKFHAHLQPLAGRWTQSVKWWMAPGAPPQVSKGTSEYKWILGGRFLLQNVKGDVEGQPFEGLGMIGYDNFKKKYTSMWTDTMTTGISTALGTCDGSGKVFTLSGTQDDVFTGKSGQKFRTITRIINEDKHVDEMYLTGPDGQEFKTLEITYTRM